MKRAARLLSAAIAIALTACSGSNVIPAGGALAPVKQAPALTPAETTNVTFTVRIPAQTAAASATRRTPAFVSSAAQGVLVQAYVHPKTEAPPAASFAVDVSAGSSACTPATGSGRTCSFALPLSSGTYDFVDTLYDAAPANGSFGSAKVLGVGTVTQTIALHVPNTVAIAIGGRVASIVLGPARKVAVNTAPLTYALTITALDADGIPIVAGTADPYDNPITITTADTGAHTTLSLNGAAPGSSATTSLSADTITVSYDGAGPSGYFATFAANADGATAGAAGFDSFNATLTLVSFLGSGETQTETIVEPHNTAPFTATPAANCANVTTVGAVSGSGSTETFVLGSGTKAGTCYVTATSETGAASVPIKVDNLVPAIVTIPQHRLFAAEEGSTPSIQAFDVANGGALVQTIAGAATTLVGPAGIARDSAGSIYVSDLATGSIDVFSSNASGNVAPTSTLQVPGFGGQGLPRDVGLDRAGDIFVLNLQATAQSPIEVFAPNSTGAAAPSQPLSGYFCVDGFDSAIAVDPSGESFFVQACGPSTLINVVPFGATQRLKTIALPTTFASAAAGAIALDVADDVFVTDPTGSTFLEYSPQAFGAATPIRVGTGLANPGGIAVANDGTVYVVTHPGSGSAVTTAIAVFAPGATSPTSTFPISNANVVVRLTL